MSSMMLTACKHVTSDR